MSRILVSAKTQAKEDVSRIMKAVSANVSQVPAAGDAAAQSPEVAIIDGSRLLRADKDEQQVLQTALEGKLPIIMKNASPEAMSLFSGVGVKADTAIIQPKGQGLRVELIDDDDLVERLAEQPPDTGSEAKPVAAKSVTAAQGEESELQEEMAAIPSLMTVPAASGDPLTSSNPFSGERPDLPEGAYHAFYVTQTRRTSNLDGKPQPIFFNPGSQVTMGYLVEIYATDYPKQKWGVISTVGTGFSMGVPISLSTTDKGYFLEYAFLEFGPRNPDDGFLERMAPESKNQITNVTNTAGFGVGVDASVGFEGWMLTGSLGVSANWDWSTSTSVEMEDFVTRPSVFNNRARWDYFLTTVGKGVYYNDWKCLPAGSYLNTLPVISISSLPVHNQAVWRFNPQDESPIWFDFYWYARVRRVYESGDQWFGLAGLRSETDSIKVDLSLVTHDRPLIIPKPQFITSTKGNDGSDDLVFYRPGADTIFYLKSKGDGEYEVIKTEVDFDKLTTRTTRLKKEPPRKSRKRYLASHMVKKGENLSFIAYKYYRSATRSDWTRIYDENRDVIGNNPNLIRPGMRLNIPFKDEPPSGWHMEVEYRPGAKIIAGSLPEAGIQLTVTDPWGNATTTVSGSKAEHGAGGFEVLAGKVTTYTLAFRGETFKVQTHDGATFVTFTRAALPPSQPA